MYIMFVILHQGTERCVKVGVTMVNTSRNMPLSVRELLFIDRVID